jgi:hypothetical protein
MSLALEGGVISGRRRGAALENTIRAGGYRLRLNPPYKVFRPLTFIEWSHTAAARTWLPGLAEA